jgi:hypothetical protein
VLDPGRGRTMTGQLWALPAVDRRCGRSDPPGVAYVDAPDRKVERPIAHLAGVKGILQLDGFAGYRRLSDRGDVRLGFCGRINNATSMNLQLPLRPQSPRSARTYCRAQCRQERDPRPTR